MRIPKLLVIVALFIALNSLIPRISKAHVVEGTSFFSPRSQSTNYARYIAGMNRYRTRTDDKPAQSYVDITPYYSHSVRAKRIADSLFGTNTLSISGSMVKDRDRESLLADYFGLSPSFESVVQFEPHIQNALMILDGHLSFDQWVNGLYFDFVAPFGWTQWYMGMDELIINPGAQTPFPARYMADEAIQAPITSFKQALTGNVHFGQMQNPIKYGKISPCPLSTSGASDILLALGWNCIQKDYGHFGINARAALPAGNRPKSIFFFEPILGNGKHSELGLGFDGHIVVWEKDGTQELSVYGGANLTHLFKTRQHRSFDLKCDRSLSRYMIFKKFNEDGDYSSNLTPIINHTTLPCTVRIDIQVDLVIMLEYVHNAYLVDIGYNGFIRSKEKICLDSRGIKPYTLGIKGIQDVTTDFGTPSNETQSTATIFGNEFDQQAEVADPHSPVFTETYDLNISSAAFPRFITNKLFTHFSYTWHTPTHYEPFIGIGAEIEFEGINPRNRTQPVHDTLGIWGLWLKGGVAL